MQFGIDLITFDSACHNLAADNRHKRTMRGVVVGKHQNLTSLITIVVALSLWMETLQNNFSHLSGRAIAVSAAIFGILTGASTVRSDNAANTDASTLERIVSVGGDATEILYALGLDKKIVAVDSTSMYPKDALETKANVGYLRQLTTEGVLSTGATVLIASAQAGPPDVVRALKSSNIRFETLPGNEAPENISEKVRFVGKIFNVPDKAEALASDVTQRFAALAEKRKAITKKIKAVFILGVNNGRANVAGTGSTADIVLGLAGADNAAASLHGYKPLTDEALISLAPEVIVTMKREGGGNAAEFVSALPGYKESPAGKAGRIIEMDGNYLLGFGPRTPQAAEELMASIYSNKK